MIKDDLNDNKMAACKHNDALTRSALGRAFPAAQVTLRMCSAVVVYLSRQ